MSEIFGRKVEKLTEELSEIVGNLIIYAFRKIFIREITYSYEVMGGTYHTYV